MGRHSSSDSEHSRVSRHKAKKKKKHRRRSRSRDRRRSVDRSRSRERRSINRSRSRSRDRRRSVDRSRSQSRGRHRRSRSRSRKTASGKHDSRGNSPHVARNQEEEKMLTHMTPAEQLQYKMHKALEAAAAADAAIRDKGSTPDKKTSAQLSAEEELKRARDIEDIEKDTFAPTSFSSSRSSGQKVSNKGSKTDSHDAAMFGNLASGFSMTLETKAAPTVYNDDSIADQSLFVSQEEKDEKWVVKLAQMRRQRLSGDVIK